MLEIPNTQSSHDDNVILKGGSVHNQRPLWTDFLYLHPICFLTQYLIKHSDFTLTFTILSNKNFTSWVHKQVNSIGSCLQKID